MQLTKNIKQICKFPAKSLINAQTPQEIIDKINIVKSTTHGAEQEQALSQIAETLPQNLKSELTALGVKLPTDEVILNVSLASLLYDLYTNNLKVPEAPFKQKALEKRLQELASDIDKDEFELKEVYTRQMINNLCHKDFNAALIFTAWVDLPEGSDPKQLYTRINGTGVKFFGTIVNAAYDILAAFATEADFND